MSINKSPISAPISGTCMYHANRTSVRANGTPGPAGSVRPCRPPIAPGHLAELHRLPRPIRVWEREKKWNVGKLSCHGGHVERSRRWTNCLNAPFRDAPCKYFRIITLCYSARKNDADRSKKLFLVPAGPAKKTHCHVTRPVHPRTWKRVPGSTPNARPLASVSTPARWGPWSSKSRTSGPCRPPRCRRLRG